MRGRGVKINRNYNRPFFSKRQRSTTESARVLFFFGLMIGGFLMFIVTQYERLQVQAMDMVGLAPPPTPFASDYATDGYNAFMIGDVDEAARLFERAVALQPENIDYVYEYGRMLIEAGREPDSIPIADQAISIAPNDPRGYALKARALMFDDPATAIQTAINGNEVDPNFAPLHAAMGVAYFNLQRWREAIAEGELAVQLDPNDAFSHRMLWLVRTYVGDYQGAIDTLQRAIDLQPSLVSPYFELAFLYKLDQVGQDTMAVATYNRILEMDPENAQAYLRLCETYANVANADFRVAQPFCDRALDIDPNYGSAYRETGRMQYNRRNYEGSIESFERCAALGAEDIECWYLRGLAHYWLAQCEDAWDILQEAQVRAQTNNEGEGVMNAIEIGLFNVTQNCEGYQNQSVPSPPPPTPIPPTPIGGSIG